MGEELGGLEQSLLRHLLTYRGHQVRFEADSRTTEFGIYRSFTQTNAVEIKSALRQLEAGRWIYRRVQYVIGFSEPKLVFSLTPNGYRKALDLFGPTPEASGPPGADGPAAPAPPTRPTDGGSLETETVGSPPAPAKSTRRRPTTPRNTAE